MKIMLNHYERENLSIPSVALKIAGINDESRLEGYIGGKALGVCKKKMTASELIMAIEFFKDLSSDFTVKLALACGQCDDCGYCACEDGSDTIPEECRQCKTPCHGAEIPACVLAEAGIDADAGLQFDARDGEVIIREIEQEWDDSECDNPDNIPAELLAVLTQSNICIQHLRDLLESGEVVYG